MSAPESTPDRAPEKGAYQAPAPFAAGRLQDRDSTSIRDRLNAMAADPRLVARAQSAVAAAVRGSERKEAPRA